MVGKMSEIEIMKQIIEEINAIISKHGTWMATKGANVYFAYQHLEKAVKYLSSEIKLLQALQKS
jgi:hypothetical protein